MSWYHFFELRQAEFHVVASRSLLPNFVSGLNPVARGLCMSSGLEMSRKPSGDASL